MISVPLRQAKPVKGEHIYLNEVLDICSGQEVKTRLSGRAFMLCFEEDALLAFEREEDALLEIEVPGQAPWLATRAQFRLAQDSKILRRKDFVPHGEEK